MAHPVSAVVPVVAGDLPMLAKMKKCLYNSKYDLGFKLILGLNPVNKHHVQLSLKSANISK